MIDRALEFDKAKNYGGSDQSAPNVKGGESHRGLPEPPR